MKRRSALIGAAAASALMAIAVGATAFQGDDASTGATRQHPPSTTPQPSVPEASPTPAKPSTAGWRAVESFVLRARHQHRGVTTAIDWESQTILLAVSRRIAPDLAALDGDSVEGLTVQVFRAAVSTREYEAFIRAVSKANFPLHDRVISFSRPMGSAYIRVNVRRLRDLRPEQRVGLLEHLARFTDEMIELHEYLETSG